MRTTPKEYRQQLYRLRAHPERQADFFDKRDSFFTVYASLIPFLIVEYWVEVSFDGFGGLVFPIGFLLYWAFYYTYYRPGLLEERLSAPTQLDLTWLPNLLIGLVIWFVKVTLVEIGHLLVFRKATPKAAPRKATASSHQRSAHQAPPRAAPSQASAKRTLPADLLEALRILGLNSDCDWKQIHRQYRALAKQFHPDLNPDITDFGRRFIQVDVAYHKLAKARAQYFSEKEFVTK